MARYVFTSSTISRMKFRKLNVLHRVYSNPLYLLARRMPLLQPLPQMARCCTVFTVTHCICIFQPDTSECYWLGHRWPTHLPLVTSYNIQWGTLGLFCLLGPYSRLQPQHRLGGEGSPPLYFHYILAEHVMCKHFFLSIYKLKELCFCYMWFPSPIKSIWHLKSV